MSTSLLDATEKFRADLNLLFYEVYSIDEAFVLDPEHTDLKTTISSGLRYEGKQQIAEKITISESKNVKCHLYFALGWNSTKKFLAVNEAKFHFFYGATREALFRYEYLRDSEKHLPNAHLHVHAHRGELSFLSNTGHREKLKQVSNIHFPLGGSLMRPSLEEILLMVDRDFHTGLSADKVGLLLASMEKFREKQIKTIIARNQHLVESLGYTK